MRSQLSDYAYDWRKWLEFDCLGDACTLVELASDLWQVTWVSKIPSSRNVIGIVTALLWVAAGVYMTLRGVNSTWKLVGYGVIAVGVWRGFMLVQHWDRNEKMTAPLRRPEYPLSHNADNADDADDTDGADNVGDDDLQGDDGIEDDDAVGDVDEEDDEDDVDDEADDEEDRINDDDEIKERQNKG